MAVAACTGANGPERIPRRPDPAVCCAGLVAPGAVPWDALRLCQNQMAATVATTITIAITQRDLLLPFIVMSFSS
ncbi:hypothetical protein E5AUHO_42740 [Citrobacter freundii]|nr:hypothetical protein E5AUHO_42740 [Citrobacter freundii]